MLESSPDHSVKDRHDGLERASRAWAAFGFGMLVVIALIAGWTLLRVSKSDEWVNHTYEILAASQQVRARLGDAKIATHDYLASGDEGPLARYRNAAADALKSFAVLDGLTPDNENQQLRLDELKPLLTGELDDLAAMIAVRKNPAASDAEKITAASREDAQTDRIRAPMHNFETEEYQLLRQRSAERNTELLRGLGGTMAAALLALAALVAAPIPVTRAVKERDTADREKQESESLATSLFEAAPQAIIIVDATGQIVMTNPATEKLFGYAPEELRGQALEVLVPEHLRTQHIDHRGRYFASPQDRPMGLNMNLKARRKDGTEFEAEISLGHITTATGSLAAAFVSDTSLRRTAESLMQRQGEELRQLAGKLISAQDDERRRIARDLHDDLSQTLAAIAIDMGRLASKHSTLEIAGELRRVKEHATQAAEHVRQISHQVHPAILDDLGLKMALEEYCSEFESRSGIVTHFTTENLPDRLPSDISDCIYHIAGECLRNASKHSGGGTVFVNVGMVGNMVHLNVRDNGIGFNLSASSTSRGIGIVTMNERARLVGGRVSIRADVAEGTTVSVEVPVNGA
jgi:PAS domain S-box-containing protein